MPQTLASSTSLLCPVAEFLKRVDKSAVAKLCSDTAVPVPIGNLSTDPVLIAALRDGGGLFEMAVSRGGRYSLADIAVVLAATSTGACGMLFRIITDATWFYLYGRRPNKDVEAPPSFKMSMELLDDLADGKKVFPFLESEQAGTIEHLEVTVDQVEARNGAVYQARDFYGRRSDRDRGAP